MINIDKIIAIESGGNPEAYNEKSGAVGLCQITEEALKDFNNYRFAIGDNWGIQSCQLSDPNINKNIGNWYINERIPKMLRAYSIPDNDMTRIIAFNWGVGNLKKWYEQLPDETRGYLKKYGEL